MSSKTKTTATKEDAKSVLVPKLRFPAFRGAKGWVQETIGEICKSFSGGTPSTTQKDYYGGNIPFIRSAEIGRTETELFLTDVGLKNSAAKLVEKGDVLIALYGANSGDVALGKIDGAINQAILCLQSESSNAFIYQFLSHRQQWIISTYLQGGQGNLSGDIVKSISLGFPTRAEQQKIAECLSSVDEVIAAQARKLDALKTHKKGLMQQLFPREGETQPRLRFPEFQGAGEWEERKLGSVCDIQRGKFSHRPRNDPRFFGGQYPFIQTGDVVKSEGGAVVASQSLNEEGLAVSKLFKPTIVLITIAANIGDTGLLETEGCFTDSVVGLIPKKDVIPIFLELIMRGQKEYLNQVATTGAQKNINNEILREVSVLLPLVPEQQRIASCLSSLDALIAAESQKVEALKTHKRGLMQQLFPSPEEVEG